MTLEAAILGVPQVIVYRGSPGMRLQYQFVKHKITVGLPNLLLDAPVCPELLDRAASLEDRRGFPRLCRAGQRPRREREAARRLRSLGRPTGRRRWRILEMGESTWVRGSSHS